MAFGDDASMTALVDQNTKRVALSVSAASMTSLTVYRVAAGEEIIVRGADTTTPTGPGLWVGYDFEAPQGVATRYAADITDGSTIVTVGPVDTSGLVDYGGDYLMPVGQPSFAINPYIEAGGMGALEREVTQDIQPVINRASPVVVSYNRKFFRGEIIFLTMNDADRKNMELLLNFPVVMFSARAGYGFDEPVYLALGTAREERTSPMGYESSRRWIISVTQVDRPPADYPYVLLGVTWQARQNVPNTWLTASTDYTDWYDYAGYPA